MKTVLLPFGVVVLAMQIHAATDVRSSRTLNDSNPLDAASVPEVPANFVFSQFADGGGYISTFLLANSTGFSTTATLALLGDIGAPLSITVDGYLWSLLFRMEMGQAF